MASLNTTVRQITEMTQQKMTKMSQRKKKTQSHGTGWDFTFVKPWQPSTPVAKNGSCEVDLCAVQGDTK